MADWVTGKVTKVQNWTDALFSLTVRAPVLPFTAGQFTKLGLEIEGERVQRAYSYVNAPDNPDLEFYLVTVPDGKLSPRLAALKPGDEVQVVSEAAGFFVLDEVPDCDTLWMLATGTAIGPYLSILQLGNDLDRFKNLVLVHAARYAADLSYLPLMQALEKRYEGKLRIQTVVSRETVADSLTGRVPALIESGELEKAVGLPMDKETCHVMRHAAVAEGHPADDQTPAPPTRPYDRRALLVRTFQCPVNTRAFCRMALIRPTSQPCTLRPAYPYHIYLRPGCR